MTTPSTSEPTPSTAPPPAQPPAPRNREIKLVSHSMLFYWWPIWFLGFFMALWTLAENHRLAIVSPHARIEGVKGEEGKFLVSFPHGHEGKPLSLNQTTQSWQHAYKISETDIDLKPGDSNFEEPFRPRISQHSWLGAMFVVGLILTIIITNVPLRGLWSFLTIIMVIVLALLAALFDAWDTIFEAVANLHIHINLAGYLFIATSVFILWGVATFIFDRRTYVIFSPGQIRVCEHIGASTQAYNTMSVSLEKQRDDLFRHYILGFGSGDLILKVSGAERREIRLPNVLGIGWQLRKIEELLKPVQSN